MNGLDVARDIARRRGAASAQILSHARSNPYAVPESTDELGSREDLAMLEAWDQGYDEKALEIGRIE